MKTKQLLIGFLFALCAVLPAVAANDAPAFMAKVVGHGTPVILIPGLSCSGEVWDGTVAQLQDRHECHVLTLAGFGGVPARGEGVITPARDALAGYIRAKHLSHPAVVGHSLGGLVALDLAAHEPGLVGKVVVVDAYPFLAGLQNPAISPEQAAALGSQIQAQMETGPLDAYQALVRAGTFTRLMVRSDSDHDRIVAWGLASDRHTAAIGVGEVMGRDYRDAIAAIKAPTLVFASWVAYSPYTDHARTEAALRTQYAKLAGAQFAISDEARHFLMLDEPQWFLQRLVVFLD